MSKLQSLNVFLTERLSAAAVEIFVVIETTIIEYQEEIFRSQKENERLRRQLDLLSNLEFKQHRADPQQLTPPVPKEEVSLDQQHCELEWSPSLGQEDPEPTTQIKEEQEKLWIHQEEEQPLGLEAEPIELISPLCVKSDGDQEDPLQPSHLYLYQTQTLENSGSNLLPSNTPEEIQTYADGEDSEPTSDSQPLSAVNPDCFLPQSENKGQMVHKCSFCRTCYLSEAALQHHVLIHTGEKQYCCHYCGKSFRQNSSLQIHIRAHTSVRLYKCHFCVKTFTTASQRNFHQQSHPGEKPHHCSTCGKGFDAVRYLKVHERIHTGLGSEPRAANGPRRQARRYELSRAVKDLYTRGGEMDQYKPQEKRNSVHNARVWRLLVDQLCANYNGTDWSVKDFEDAARTRYWTERDKHILTHTPSRADERGMKKRRRRRQRQALIRRFKELTQEEKERWRGATEDMMSDVETDPEDPQGLVVFSPSWRSPEFESLIRKAEERRQQKGPFEKRHRRQMPTNSVRQPPQPPYPGHLIQLAPHHQC